MRSYAATVLALGILGGCGSEWEEPCIEGMVTVAVSAAPAPIVSWSPQCSVSRLMVRPATGIDVSWYVLTEPETNTLESAITYGVLPPGAVLVQPPRPLSRGTEYEVNLLIVKPVQGGVQIHEVARGTFVY